MSEYLSNHRTFYPTEKLKSLLSNTSGAGLPAKAKMDKLYADILLTCDWSDQKFLEMYDLVVGSIVAAKSPLTVSGIQSLHGKSQMEILQVLRPLNSVFTGIDEDGQYVRIIHAS